MRTHRHVAGAVLCAGLLSAARGDPARVVIVRRGTVDAPDAYAKVVREHLDDLKVGYRLVGDRELSPIRLAGATVLVLPFHPDLADRPSDAIALATRVDAPLFASAAVMEEAGVEIRDEDEEEAEVERFREFLEDIRPEDFGTPSS